MEFEEFKDQVANYLEDAGIDSTSVSDDMLGDLWSKKVKPANAVDVLRAAGAI